MLEKYRSGLTVVLVGLASMIGTAHAALPASVSTSFDEMQTDFNAVFALAFPVLATIVVAMIAWRYTRKFGNKL